MSVRLGWRTARLGWRTARQAGTPARQGGTLVRQARTFARQVWRKARQGWRAARLGWRTARLGWRTARLGWRMNKLPRESDSIASVLHIQPWRLGRTSKPAAKGARLPGQEDRRETQEDRQIEKRSGRLGAKASRLMEGVANAVYSSMSSKRTPSPS